MKKIRICPCTKCGEDITEENRVTQNKQKDLMNSWCKACFSSLQKARRKRNKQQDPIGFAEKESARYLSRDRESDRKSQYAWMERNQERVFRQRLWQLYKITPEKYQEMMEEQDNVCGCCKQPFDPSQKEPCVDHDHACCPSTYCCGKCVRGLLCRRCNVALGYFEKRPFMVDYLHKTKRKLEDLRCQVAI